MTDRAVDRPIAVGDLVVVILPGCIPDNVGIHFVVTDATEYDGDTCAYCSIRHGTGRKIFHGITLSKRGKWFSESRLKRIPPLEELEGEQSQTTISELGRQLLGHKEPA